MTILNLPETAKIIKRQKCPVKNLTAGNYIMRSGYSPLAEVSVTCELDQADINALVSEIEQAKGINQLELPYISSSESYLVQEYKVIPIVYGKNATLELKMVQQRKSLVAENLAPLTIDHVPLDDSTQTSSFKVITKQLAGGVQASKLRGTFNSENQYWSVKFLLTLAEAQAIDQQLVGKRGIYSFKWSPNQDSQAKDQWFCAEWEIEYFANDLHIFSGQFLKDEFFEKLIINVFQQVFSSLSPRIINGANYVYSTIDPSIATPDPRGNFIYSDLSPLVTYPDESRPFIHSALSPEQV